QLGLKKTQKQWGEGAGVGAGLARDAGTSVCQSHRSDAIAGKPVPTQARSHIFDRRRSKNH
ncbi:hypothetical protein QN404_28115, partial [Pseudomonas sp. RTS1]|nr:hypothetical protein [Pseudomonas sp. RTS1]